MTNANPVLSARPRQLSICGVQRLNQGLIGAAIVIGLLAVGGASVWVWFNIAAGVERLTAEGDVAAFGTLYLAIVAAGVALMAYQVSTRTPDVVAEIKFKFSEPNVPILAWADPENAGDALVPLDDIDLVARVRLTNKRKFSARNPHVRLELTNMSLPNAPKGWEVAEKWSASDATGITWDGGDRSIHDWRVLPPVDLTGVKALRQATEYRIDLHVAAEGFVKTFHVPVTILNRKDFERVMAASVTRDSAHSATRR